MVALGVALVLVGVALLLPSLVLLIEVVGALLPEPPKVDDRALPRPRLALLVPAHDEEEQVASTVRPLLTQLRPGDRLIVVADNCTDETATRARSAGAEVIERQDHARRGKGYAIAFGLRHLDQDPPEIVILVDADCRVEGDLGRLATAANVSGRPVQAEYLLSAPPRPSPTTAVSALAILVRNRVRPRGLNRLGLPCQLTGSGMAFPWRVLREAPETEGNLVEDLVMGVEMALAGHPPRFFSEVQISSALPTGANAARSQRRRWEHGQLHTLSRYAPRLLWAGTTRGRLALVALGLDLAVPPLALLTATDGAFLLMTATLAAVGVTGPAPLAIALLDVTLLVAAVALAWVGFGRRIIPLRYGLLIPLYVVGKLPLYLSLFVRGRHKAWERTARGSAEEPPAPKN